MPQITATFRWQTALPVHEALRRQAGASKTDESQVAPSLTAPVSTDVIAVLALPETMPFREGGRYRRGAEDDSDRHATAIPTASTVKIRDVSQPQRQGLALDDKEVEFVTRYGPLEIKRKFKLRRLEL